MKSKLTIFALLAVCLCWGRPAKADTIVDISATFCPDCFGTPLPVDFHAQATVTPSTGTFVSPLGFSLTNALLVTSLSGTLNGSPISLRPAPQGDGSWLFPDLFIGALYFSGDSCPCSMFWDGAFGPIITSASGNTPVNYSATVSTPEAGTLGLLGLGFAFLCWRLNGKYFMPAKS